LRFLGFKNVKKVLKTQFYTAVMQKRGFEKKTTGNVIFGMAHFLQLDAMLAARVPATALRLSVCVCLSQVGVLSNGMNGLISYLARLLSTSPALRYKKIQVISKIMVFLSGSLS